MTFAEKEEMGDRLCFAHQALTGEIKIGRKVLVIGGGSVGSGTADFLAENGHDVTLLLRRTDIGSKLEPSTKMVIKKRLEKNGVRIIRKAHFESFGNGKVRIEREGTEEFLDADNVIIAIGSKPENSLYQRMKGKRKHVYAIGDCVEPRGIFEAIAEGAVIGRIV
jgi:2,4-dienoyl-CoA reductase (NADPH2)